MEEGDMTCVNLVLVVVAAFLVWLFRELNRPGPR